MPVTERELVTVFLPYAMILCGVMVFVMLFFLKAGYGRYSSEGALSLDARVAWVLQELPSLILPLYYAWRADFSTLGIVNQVLLSLFTFHYFNRTCIFPLRLRGGKRTPAFICFLAFCFTSINGYMQGLAYTSFIEFPESWLWVSVMAPVFNVAIHNFLSPGLPVRSGNRGVLFR